MVKLVSPITWVNGRYISIYMYLYIYLQSMMLMVIINQQAWQLTGKTWEMGHLMK